MSTIAMHSIGRAGAAQPATTSAAATLPLLRDRVGAKASALAELARAGLPVPPAVAFEFGFRELPAEGARRSLRAAIAALEAATGTRFGDPNRPLLVALRSSPRESSPGSYATMLNLGLTPAVVEAMCSASPLEERFALDTQRRLIAAWANEIGGLREGQDLGGDRFVGLADELRRRRGTPSDQPLDLIDLRRLVERSRTAAVEAHTPLPEDPWQQLEQAAAYVLDAKEPLGLVVQAMVFGNRDDASSTGVAISRDPSTGEPRLVGEYLPVAQGDDVVGGKKSPRPLTGIEDPRSLEHSAAERVHELRRWASAAERVFRDVQELEFTIEGGRLWILQSRPAKRSPKAALVTAQALWGEGLISPRAALALLGPRDFRPTETRPDTASTAASLFARGLGASVGFASGTLAFHKRPGDEGVILVRREITRRDVEDLRGVRALLTIRGGTTSHGAVIARAMRLPAVVGAQEITIDPARGLMFARGRTLKEGALISLDGATGEVFLGRIPGVADERDPAAEILLREADRLRRLRIYSLDAERPVADGAWDRASAERLSLDAAAPEAKPARSSCWAVVLDALPDAPELESRLSTWAARATGVASRPLLGMVGAAAGEPDAVRAAHRFGFDFVACPPEATPVARWAAALATSDDQDPR